MMSNSSKKYRYDVFITAFFIVLELVLLSNATPTPELTDSPVASTPSTAQLIQTHIIFRHGDRAPVNLYKNDPNEGHVWPYGLGQLTNIGKRQQSELGTFLRNRYQDFFTTNPQEIEVKSSDKDRCIASTQVNLAAFFKPKGKWIWNEELLWQPVPIHTKPKKDDYLLNEDFECPAAKREAANLLQSPQGVAFTEKYHDLMEYMTNHSGEIVHDPESVLDVQGTINIEKIKNLIIPDWVNLRWGEMLEAANDAMTTQYTSKVTQRLRGGPLLNHVIELMKERANQTVEKLPKGFMYSTHDAIIAALTSALGVFNGQVVPYCATVLIELHSQPENQSESPTPSLEPNVRIYYRNGTEHAPFQMRVPGCELDCPLTQFVTLLENVTPKNINAECNVETSRK